MNERAGGEGRDGEVKNRCLFRTPTATAATMTTVQKIKVRSFNSTIVPRIHIEAGPGNRR